ncbi:MAG: hypothetical protein M1320_01575 [Patescibacteria group bacterium]|nr:hypothetical protein [Patescibacteria group bacterium]
MERDLKDAVIQIMKLLYDHDGEIVVHVSEEKTSIFLSGRDHEIQGAVVNVLTETEIIEQDGGNAETENETLIFKLTPSARRKIRDILQKTKPKVLPAP